MYFSSPAQSLLWTTSSLRYRSISSIITFRSGAPNLGTINFTETSIRAAFTRRSGSFGSIGTSPRQASHSRTLRSRIDIIWRTWTELDIRTCCSRTSAGGFGRDVTIGTSLQKALDRGAGKVADGVVHAAGPGGDRHAETSGFVTGGGGTVGG